MAKFYGEIGFGHTEEQPADSGVFKQVITARNYYGDVRRNSRQLQEGEKINNDLSVNNTQISIVADAYASENFFAMLYINWAGAYWIVSDVDATQRPRLVLTLGGVYNGPKAPAPESP
jgi:hypothetical protein